MHFGFGLTAAVCAGLIFSFALSATADAASLAGQVGEKRRGQVLPGSATGSCGAAWKAYVAASGHSAYASTRYAGPYVRNGNEAIYCGIDRNAASQKAAEQRAIANCDAARKKYKMRSIGPCEIVASK
jgi:hypothetical protein